MIGMGQMVTCDACKANFEMTDKSVRNRQSNDVLFTYFQCPHCGAAFLISATDDAFRKRLLQRCNGMRRNRATPYMDQDVIRRLSKEQTEKYRPRFRELVPTAYEKEEQE